jgi:hypothetical protein
MVRPVGKHDSRNSMKMKRRKSQVKKKSRLKRQKAERKVASGHGGPKKAAPRKSAKAATPVSEPSPPTTPTGTVPI